MSFWDIIDFLVDFIFGWNSHWGFKICFYIGLALASLTLIRIPNHILGGVVALFFVTAGVIAGIYFDRD